MPQLPLKCVKCGTAMEEGFVLDNTYGARLQAEWVEGAPEGSRWMGIKTKGKDHHSVLTYRCPNCSYLESYAPASPA